MTLHIHVGTAFYLFTEGLLFNLFLVHRCSCRSNHFVYEKRSLVRTIFIIPHVVQSRDSVNVFMYFRIELVIQPLYFFLVLIDKRYMMDEV